MLCFCDEYHSIDKIRLEESRHDKGLYDSADVCHVSSATIHKKGLAKCMGLGISLNNKNFLAHISPVAANLQGVDEICEKIKKRFGVAHINGSMYSLKLKVWFGGADCDTEAMLTVLIFLEKLNLLTTFLKYLKSYISKDNQSLAEEIENNKKNISNLARLLNQHKAVFKNLSDCVLEKIECDAIASTEDLIAVQYSVLPDAHSFFESASGSSSEQSSKQPIPVAHPPSAVL